MMGSNLESLNYKSFDLIQLKILYEHIDIIFESQIKVEFSYLNDYNEMIWDRSLLNARWPENKIIVFGHTPTCYLHEYTYAKWQHESEMRPAAYRATYNDGDISGWHIDMDTGMTFYGRGYVLNCLTLDAVGFLDQDVKKQDSKRAVEIGFENFKII